MSYVDEELSNSVALQSGKDAKKSSVPKRLLIGNDEYVELYKMIYTKCTNPAIVNPESCSLISDDQVKEKEKNKKVVLKEEENLKL